MSHGVWRPPISGSMRSAASTNWPRASSSRYPQLLHGLQWSTNDDELAEALWTDVHTVRVRRQTLTPMEIAWLDKHLDDETWDSSNHASQHRGALGIPTSGRNLVQHRTIRYRWPTVA